MHRNCRVLTSLFFWLLATTAVWSQAFKHDYEGKGSWFLGFDLGTSLSVNENVHYADLFKTRIPTGGVVLGRTLTPRWSFRVSALCSSQIGHAPDPIYKTDKELYKPYDFYTAVGTFDLMLNVTNCFRHYDSRNWFDFYLVFGGGEIYRFGVSDHAKKWHHNVYPVDSDNAWFWTGKVGVETAWHVRRSLDLTAEVDLYATDNAYNGVSRPGRPCDWFLSVRLGLVYYLPNFQHRHRFANPKKPHLHWTNLN